MGDKRTKNKHLPVRLYKRADGYYYRNIGAARSASSRATILPWLS